MQDGTTSAWRCEAAGYREKVRQPEVPNCKSGTDRLYSNSLRADSKVTISCCICGLLAAIQNISASAF